MATDRSTPPTPPPGNGASGNTASGNTAPGAADPLTATAEYPGDDAGYAWWRHANPGGYVLAVRARAEPLLHRAGCGAVDRDRHPGRLRAVGSRQLCATTKPALRAWLAREWPGATAMVARCPTCGP